MPGEYKFISVDSIINYPLAKIIAPYLNYLRIKPNYITILNILLRFYIIKKIKLNLNN